MQLHWAGEKSDEENAAISEIFVAKPGDIIFIAQKEGDSFNKNTIAIGVFVKISMDYVQMSNIVNFKGSFSISISRSLDEICYVKVIMSKDDFAVRIQEILKEQR